MLASKGIARFVFTAFKVITKKLCAAIDNKGFYEVVIAGWCPAQSYYRVFNLTTRVSASELQHHLSEIHWYPHQYLSNPIMDPDPLKS